MGASSGRNNGDLQADIAAETNIRPNGRRLSAGFAEAANASGRRGSGHAAAPALTQGEIADRISILELKSHYDHSDVIEELVDLVKFWRGSDDELDEMREINGRGWMVVGRIHDHFDEVNVLPDASIIELCRAAHMLNRDRVAAKNRINERFHQPREFKTWKRTTT